MKIPRYLIHNSRKTAEKNTLQMTGHPRTAKSSGIGTRKRNRKAAHIELAPGNAKLWVLVTNICVILPIHNNI